jgi:hypothetical protein
MCMASRKPTLLWTTVSSLVVVAAAAAAFFVPKGPTPAVADSGLVDGENYYVLLRSIEVEPRREDGDGWDSSDGAPDLYYVVRWRDTEVFRSSRKDDTLVAIWSNSEVGVMDLTGGVSIDGSIKAARVTARAGESIEFMIFDQDDLTPDDEVATVSIGLESLRVGENDRAAGNVRLKVRVIAVSNVGVETLTR